MHLKLLTRVWPPVFSFEEFFCTNNFYHLIDTLWNFFKETYGETIIRKRFYEKFFSFHPSLNSSLKVIFYEAVTRSSSTKKVFLKISHPATRRRSDAVTTSLCTSQWRCRYVSNETPNDVSVERRQDVSVVRLHDVSNKSQMKHPMTSQCYVTKTSQWYVCTTSH